MPATVAGRKEVGAVDHHAYWTEYLAQGRRGKDTTNRPIAKSRNKRVTRQSNGDIALRYHATDCVIFHPDGYVTYDTGGWHTVTTLRFLNEYGPVRVWSAGGQWFLRDPSPGHTPPKIQKCRICHGKGKVPNECYGPRYCYGYYDTGTCEHGNRGAHQRDVCEHGQAERHPLPDINCYRCNGVGRRDYGSKPIHIPWSGSMYLFHPDNPQDGNAVLPWGTPKPESATASGHDYGRSGEILMAAMPDMTKYVRYPCGCTRNDAATVQGMIIHLNDGCLWSRERVADWLETLDLDLRFPVNG